MANLLPLVRSAWGGTRRLLLIAACRLVPAVSAFAEPNLRLLFSDLDGIVADANVDLVKWIDAKVNDLTRPETSLE